MDKVKKITEIDAHFGSGTYFVGDICYCLKDDIYHDIWGKIHNYKDGIYEYKGMKFTVAGTAYGDECYGGTDKREYLVDAGVIGIVPKELFKDKLDYNLEELGKIIEVKDYLSFSSNGRGVFRISVDGFTWVIDTKYEGEDQ